MTTIKRCYRLLVIWLLQMAPSLSQKFRAFPVSLYQIDNLKTKCLDPMVTAANGDDKITASELPNFIKLLAHANNLSDPKFEVNEYSSLPDSILIEYNSLICRTTNGVCDTGLNVHGAATINSVDSVQKDFLETICKEFIVAMKKELGPSPQPSSAPIIAPSKYPSEIPSINPTDVPSLIPTVNPTSLPSSTPSLAPTASPSISPSLDPTISPSFRPSLSPTRIPSVHPTRSPNNSPTINPSDVPSSQPSIKPSAKPSPYVPKTGSPSLAPSMDPSDRPSLGPSEKVFTVAIEFGVANMNGYQAMEFAKNIEGSLGMIESVFDEFSEEIKQALFVQTIGGKERKLRNVDHERSLGVDFQHNFITNIEDKGCPDFIKNQFKNRSPTPLCQIMDGVIVFVVTEPSSPMMLEEMIKSRAEDLIQKNVMSNKIPDEERDAFVIYSIRVGQTTIPVGIITGFSIGSALLGLFVGRLLVKRRIRGKGGLNDQYDGLDAVAISGEMTTDEEECGSNPLDHHHSPSSYRGLAEEALYERREMHDVSMERSSIASSSNAGSSGWSSSAGISSLNTASVDSSEYFGSSLAAIGAASVISKRYDRSPGSREEMYPMVADIDESSMSESDLGGSELETDDDTLSPSRNRRQFEIREELDHAIQSGDWSLVGATAAIIAQAPSEFISIDVNSTFSSDLSSPLRHSQRKNERAIELDRLVEMGDWEGVVLAAAKFEAENDRDGGTEESASSSEGQKFLASKGITHQGDNNSTNSPSVSTNISESASNNIKRAEIRAEIEALVRRVVPDEIDNVDEMIFQFNGREEELVETLRTMQERSIAARQREAMRRNAKREARKMAKQNKPPLGRLSPSVNGAAPQDRLATKDINASFYTASSNLRDSDCGPRMSIQSKDLSNATPNRAALDYAIQIGDWEAVGKTAEQLGEGGSISSEYHTADECSSLFSSKSLSSRPDAERAAELEGLIDQGDWSGVVAAASRYTAADVKERSKKRYSTSNIQNNCKESTSVATESSWKLPLIGESTSSDRHLDDCVSQSTEAKKEKTIKEEKDALAQAEIWMTIAAQSKNEDSNATKGASDAADWAISRSLKQIQASSSEDGQETRSVASSNDDKSV